MARMDSEKRSKALELRCSGMGYAKIAREIGTSTGRAAKIVTAEIQRLLALKGDVGEAARELELQRLDSLLASVWEAATAGDLPAWDRALAAIQARVRLMGLGSTTGKKGSAPAVVVQILESAAPAKPRVAVIEQSAGILADRAAAGTLGNPMADCEDSRNGQSSPPAGIQDHDGEVLGR